MLVPLTCLYLGNKSTFPMFYEININQFNQSINRFEINIITIKYCSLIRASLKNDLTGLVIFVLKY